MEASQAEFVAARSLASVYDVMGDEWDFKGASAAERLLAFRATRTIQLMQARGEELPEPLAHLATGVECFTEYVMVDEASGAQVVNGDFHVEWQRFFDRNRFGVILAPVGHGKTQQIVISRQLYALGKNPELRIGIVCGNLDQAEDRVSAIASHIVGNARLHEVFPKLRPSNNPRDPWSSKEITVQREERGAKDPSIRAYGVGSGSIQGARLDKVVMDDVLDETNTRTPEARKKVLMWFDVKVFTRLPPDGSGTIEVIGTPWHSDDLLHTLAERGIWGSQVWSAVLNPDDPQAEWEALWPEVVTVKRLRELANGMHSSAFMRKFCCRSRDEGTARFQVEWIDNCLRQGRGLRMLDKQPRVGVGGDLLPCFTGVDLGVGQKEEHDLSVIFTAALRRDRKRQIVDIQAGRWTGPEIVQRIVRTQRRFDSRVIVESNAAQEYISQFTIQQGTPTESFHTGKNKHNESFGVESLAVELRAGLWVFPSNDAGEATDEDMKALIRGMMNFTSNPKEHTSDYLMAMWFVRESIRSYLGQLEASAQMIDIQYR